jgi:hypothetical protein
MSRNKISERIQQQVRNRTNYLCEFCHANEQWQYVRRATVAALLLNRERVISIRAADLEIGRHPPLDDPIQSNI